MWWENNGGWGGKDPESSIAISSLEIIIQYESNLIKFRDWKKNSLD